MPDKTAQPAPRYGRYFLWLAGLCLLLYPLPYFLIRAPHYDEWSTSPYGRDLEYGMTAAHIDADVLIYGDSTALYGLSPQRMSDELGVKVFNIPNVLPSLRVTGDLGLRRYLAANKPPRLIVLYLAPWDLDYSDFHANDTIYDGEEMLLRHGTAVDIASFARRHPDAYLQFPFIFYRVQSWSGLLHPEHEPTGAALTQGERPVPPFAPMTADCALPRARATGHLPMQTTRDLLAKFNTGAAPAVVYIAPIPDCAHAEVVTHDDYRPLHAAAPRLLPAVDFVQDGYYAHPVGGKVQAVTDQLVEAIRPLLRQSAAKP